MSLVRQVRIFLLYEERISSLFSWEDQKRLSVKWSQLFGRGVVKADQEFVYVLDQVFRNRNQCGPG